MRVLIVHELYPPDIAGGGENVVRGVAEGLQRHGHEVSVLTTGDPENRGFNGVPVSRLPISRYKLNLAARRVAEAARDADVIHAFNYHACLPAFLAGRRLGKPAVCEILGLFTDEWLRMRGPIAGRMYRAWERRLLTLPFDRTVFISDYSAEIAVRLGVPRERCVVNFPGINHEHYFSSPERDVDVLFMGKLTVRKGIEDVLEVARRLPDLQFRVVGWSEDYEAVRAAAPGNIIMDVEAEPMGPVPFIFEALSRARILLFPSRAETFGLVIAEAMASGCAVVSSVPLNFAGAVITPGDIEGITEAVRRLAEDREGTAAMGRENIERAKAYSWDRHVEILSAMYEELLAGRHAAAGVS